MLINIRVTLAIGNPQKKKKIRHLWSFFFTWKSTNNLTAQITTQSKTHVRMSMASENVIHCKHELFNNMVQGIPVGF